MYTFSRQASVKECSCQTIPHPISQGCGYRTFQPWIEGNIVKNYLPIRRNIKI
jgi:hypothetical protein